MIQNYINKYLYTQYYLLGYFSGILDRFPYPVSNFISLATPVIIMLILPIPIIIEVSILFIYLYMLNTDTLLKINNDKPLKYIPLFALSRGRSMYPNIASGYTFSLIQSKNNISTGDVVVFKNKKGKKIQHRIITTYENEKYKIKGDNNYTDDGIYTKEDILYKTYCIKNQPIFIPVSLTSIIETITIIIPRKINNFRKNKNTLYNYTD